MYQRFYLRVVRPRKWMTAASPAIFREQWDCPGVYVLYLNGQVVYVGRGRSVRTRVLYHNRRFTFDHIKVAIESDAKERRTLERKLLLRLQPPMNAIVPRYFSGSAPLQRSPIQYRGIR